MPDFPANPKPDYPLEETTPEPEVLITRHRDGTEQRRYKGAGRRRTFRLRYTGLTNAERQTLQAHFLAQNGAAVSCNWVHPERTSETYKVRYTGPWSFTLAAYDMYDAAVELQEVTA